MMEETSKKRGIRLISNSQHKWSNRWREVRLQVPSTKVMKTNYEWLEMTTWYSCALKLDMEIFTARTRDLNLKKGTWNIETELKYGLELWQKDRFELRKMDFNIDSELWNVNFKLRLEDRTFIFETWTLSFKVGILNRVKHGLKTF